MVGAQRATVGRRLAVAAVASSVAAALTLSGCAKLKGGSAQAAESDEFASTELRTAAKEADEFGVLVVTAMDEGYKLDGDPHYQSAQILGEIDGKLRENVILTTFVTEQTIRGPKEAIKPAMTSQHENSEKLVEGFATLFERETTLRFKKLWEAHDELFEEYAKAAAARDQGGKTQQRQKLMANARDLAAFVDEVTNGSASAPIVEKELSKHVDEMLAIIDAQAASPSDWYTKVHPAVEHMEKIALLLAGGVSETKGYQGKVKDFAAELRSKVSGLMMQNVYYVGGYQARAVLKGSPDAVAKTSDLVRQNTDDLTKEIKSVMGDQYAGMFKKAWDQQSKDFGDYLKALKANDTQGRVKAKDELVHFSEDIGEFFQASTGKKVDALAVEKVSNKVVESMIQALREQAHTGKE